MIDSRVMPTCDPSRSNPFGVVMQFSKLQPVIATHTWVGCTARVVFIFEIADDLFEVICKVQGVEGDVEFGRDAAGIVGIGDRAAASVAKSGASNIVAGRSKTHKTAHDVIALLLEHGSCDAGVHAAGHGDEDTISWLGLHGYWR